ncbi:MAG: helix-turn-helix transcriptional regulator [Candidatus Aminicenantes bacterium]|nr:helix-turn-helix transcriptional regulator [Candidatus Aminicenantes bacterium]
MRILTRTEEVILAAVWKLHDNAYGVSVNEYINKKTGLDWKFGSIYTPLGRLVEKGLLRTIKGEPSPERGGRRKIFFQLTKEGKKALLEIQKLNSVLWQDMPSLETR